MLCLVHVGIDRIQKSLKFFEVQLRIFLEAQAFPHFLDVNVLRIDLESEITHHILVLILKFLIFIDVINENSFEDRVAEEIVPADPIPLINLQGLMQEILALLAKIFIDDQRFFQNGFHQFI